MLKYFHNSKIGEIMNLVQETGFLKEAIRVKEKLYESTGGDQKIEVYKSEELGNILVIDKKAVMSQKDGHIYHEMLSHVPICTHKKPKRVLLLGGGNGGVAHELMRHSDLEVDMVEISQEVIDVSKKYFKEYHPTNRVKLFIKDGVEFVERADEATYDVVIVDSDYEKFYTKEFIAKLHKILKDDGVMATQGGSYMLDMAHHKELLKNIGESFYIVMPYRYEMLCYPAGVWNFILASKKYHPTADVILQRVDLIDGLKYYNCDIHQAAFALPSLVSKELRGFAKK
jgi:spermidine synthase